MLGDEGDVFGGMVEVVGMERRGCKGVVGEEIGGEDGEQHDNVDES